MKTSKELAKEAHYAWARQMAKSLNREPDEQELRSLGIVPWMEAWDAAWAAALAVPSDDNNNCAAPSTRDGRVAPEESRLPVGGNPASTESTQNEQAGRDGPGGEIPSGSNPQRSGKTNAVQVGGPATTQDGCAGCDYVKEHNTAEEPLWCERHPAAAQDAPNSSETPNSSTQTQNDSKFPCLCHYMSPCPGYEMQTQQADSKGVDGKPCFVFSDGKPKTERNSE